MGEISIGFILERTPKTESLCDHRAEGGKDLFAVHLHLHVKADEAGFRSVKTETERGATAFIG